MAFTRSYDVRNVCKSTRLPPKIIFTEFQHLAMWGCRYVKLGASRLSYMYPASGTAAHTQTRATAAATAAARQRDPRDPVATRHGLRQFIAAARARDHYGRRSRG
jgi:hypothetical protein